MMEDNLNGKVLTHAFQGCDTIDTFLHRYKKIKETGECKRYHSDSTNYNNIHP